MKLSEKGFTIIEVLMGVSVFALGLMGIMALLMTSVNSNAFASRLTEADMLATSTLERLMRLPGGDPLLVDTDGDGALPANSYGLHDIGAAADQPAAPVATGNNLLFTIVWNTAPGQPELNSTLICVTVTWNEKGVLRRTSMTGVKINEFT